MNKRSSGSDRPRSARLRRRPSNGPEEEHVQEFFPHSFEREQSELTNKDAKSKPELNLLETSNRLGMKNKMFGRDKEKATANHKLTLPNSMELPQDAKNANFTNFYQRAGREPPKSPRVLPKLEKNSVRKAMMQEESAVAKNDAPDFLMFLDKKKNVDGEGLHLGKQYSVLPNISHSNEAEDSDVAW